MSRFSSQLRKIPKDRVTLRNYYLFFSGIWVAGILAYALGYRNKIVLAGGHMSYSQIAFFAVILLVPLAVIWFPYLLTMGDRFEQSLPKTEVATLDPAQLKEISFRLEKLSNENAEVKLALGDILSGVSAVVHGQDASASHDARMVVAQNLDAPILPLSEATSDNARLSLRDVAIALDFTDQVQKGDWAIAFERVQAKGSFLELLRNAESVIDIFEEEGVFVEDLAIDLPPEHAWRALAKNERNVVTEKLGFIKDRSAQTLIRSRLKSDPSFQDASLRFQKRFIEMLDAMAGKSAGGELDALAKSRAGRAFALLGDISGTFGTKDKN